jgi:hypothetical protein
VLNLFNLKPISINLKNLSEKHYLVEDSLALLSENHYQMSAHHYLMGDKPSLMVFYDYLLLEKSNRKKDGVCLIKEGDRITF